jgi:hypothetical protein
MVVKLQHEHQMELYQDCRADTQDAPQTASVRIGSGSQQVNLCSISSLTDL